MDKDEFTSLLDEMRGEVQFTLDTLPKVEVNDAPTQDDIPSVEAGTWLKIPKVVAVVADLKNSTQLGTGGRHDTSTARVYKASVEGSVKILNRFGADFIDIQGDGGFGLFWGSDAVARAVCAGVTIRTFSEDFVERFEKKSGGNVPETGFKVGIALGRVLVKNLGTPRNPSQQEAVWAGKPVNYATKCAQSAGRHEIVIAGSVWDAVQGNEYLAISCGCKTAPSISLWEDITIDRLPAEDNERYGRTTSSGWCANCGPGFVEAVMAGKRKRDDVSAEVQLSLRKSQMKDALASVAQQRRQERWMRPRV